MAFVQAPNPTSTAGSVNTSISLAFGSNNTAGNCLLACITWSSFSGAVLTGVTDTRGNTWVQVGERQVDLHNINTFCALFAAFNCAAGSNTVTANYSTSGSDYLQLAIREYSGAASIDDTDGTAIHLASTGTLTTPNVTTSFNSEDVVAFFMGPEDTSTMTTGTGYGNAVSTTTNGSSMSEDKVQATASGSVTATATGVGAGFYFAMILSLRASVATTTLDAIGSFPGSREAYAYDRSDAALPMTVAWNHTCSGSNRAVIVAASFSNETGSDASVTLSASFGGTTMTLLGTATKTHAASGGTHGFVQMFGLVAPPTGASGVTITASGSGATGRLYLNGGSVSFFNVDQTTPFGTPVTANGTSFSPSVNVTSTNSSNMVVDAVADGDLISSSTQLLRFLANNGNIGGADNLGCATAYGNGGTVTMGYNGNSNNDWAIAAVEVRHV